MTRCWLMMPLLLLGAGCGDDGPARAEPDEPVRQTDSDEPEPTAVPAPPRPELAVGERFPDIAFPRAGGGEPVRISDFRGQKVALHVFASW